MEETLPRYVFGIGGNVYKIYQDKLYNDPVYVNGITKYPDETVTDLIFRSKYETIYGGKSGIYGTFYSYYLDDDFHCGEISDVVNTIKSSYDGIITKHIGEYHNNSSTITILNNKMPSDCSDMSQIKKSGRIQNIYDKVKFDDYNRYVKANTYHSESLSSLDQNDISGVSYIYMKTLNGANNDIYIHIPTTNTYYMSHPYGVPNCSHDEDKIERKNCSLTNGRNIEDGMTYVDVILDNEFFNIEDILHCEVNGTSLPMKIYKEGTEIHPDGNSFNSLILPSMIYR